MFRITVYFNLLVPSINYGTSLFLICGGEKGGSLRYKLHKTRADSNSGDKELSGENFHKSLSALFNFNYKKGYGLDRISVICPNITFYDGRSKMEFLFRFSYIYLFLCTKIFFQSPLLKCTYLCVKNISY